MKKNNLFRTLKTYITITVFSLAFISCGIGLGEAVDLEAPEVEVTSPVAQGSVSKNLMITGSASDNEGVKDLTVSIEETGQKYVWNGAWEKYDLSTKTWVPCSKTEATFTGDEKKFTWTIQTQVYNAKSGDNFTLSTVVTDAIGNGSKNSKDERSFTVDVDDPVVSIIVPLLLNYKSAAHPNSSYLTYDDIKAESDGYPSQDNMVLQKLINKDFTIDGTQKEDTQLGKLYVMLDEGKSDTVVSYSAEKELKKIADSLICIKEIDGNRSWSTSITQKDIPQSYQTGRHLVRLITESHDLSGNVERKVQGWFTYDNGADVPWIDVKFGDSAFNATDQTEVYPSCTLQGQCYDDDGLESIEVRTYICKDTTGTDWEEVTEKYVNFSDDLTKDNKPTFFAWSINAISDNKNFKIVISCKDKNGVKGTDVVRYLSVADVNPPELSDVSPANGITTIGDANGNITISGKVRDDGKLNNATALKMVRICKEQKNNILGYFDANDVGWSKETNGNKLFTIPLTGGEEAVGGYYNYTFSKVFNIFSDFGINGTETIGSQTFIFCVVDSNGSSTIESYSYQGDTQAPELTVDTLTVKHASSGSKDYTLKNGNQPTLDPYVRDNNGKITDKIKYSGTWKDDSAAYWGNDANGKKRIGTLNLESKGVSEIPVTIKNDGTWESGFVTPNDSTTASLTATLTDWGGNSTKVVSSYYMNSSLPELIRISSVNPDGAYKAGDEIIITMEFNKKVILTGDGAILTLNNGRTAVYDKNNTDNSDVTTTGSAKHYYKYVVGGGGDTENTTKLNVTKIDSNGSTWKDTDKALISDSDIKKLPEMNLENIRNIVIDKVAPKIKEVKAITPNGSYKIKKELFFTVEFEEDVSYTSLSTVKLNLKIGTDEISLDPVSQTSSTTLLFKYVVQDGDNGLVAFNSFNIGSGDILDKASNKLTNTTPKEKTLGTINIDTDEPSKPNISGIKDGDIVYDPKGKKVTISGYEKGAEKYYSVDNGTTWGTYPDDGIPLTANGTYKIKAYQVDEAGNKSSESVMKTVKLDTGNILTSITSSTPDGTYTTGRELSITLNFRIPVIVSGSKLKLNIKDKESQAKEIFATPKSEPTSGASSIEYTYKIGSDDDCTLLNVEAFIFDKITDTDKAENDLSSYVPLPANDSGNKLSDNRTIQIVTGSPEVSDVDFSSDSKKLNITFTSEIEKGSGNITIKMKENTFIAPIAMTKDEWGSCSSAIQAYYKKGTNGMTKDGTSLSSDLSEKYVLEYNTDPTNTTLTGLFTTAGKDTVTIPIDSTAVTITGTGSNILSIDISNAYKLPVKGAEYVLTVPADLVKNVLETPNPAISDSLKNIRAPGVESPVVRINKSKETFTKNGGAITAVNQPYTATAKINCRTPEAVIYYKDSSKTSEQKSYTSKGNVIKRDTSSDVNTAPADSTITTEYEQALTVGSSTDKVKGYKVLIASLAKLPKSVTGEEADRTSEASYESAYRTVVVFTDSSGKKTGDKRWIRGGDWTSGGVSTPDFPLSWNKDEYDKIRAMTNESENDWYWVTWSLNTTAYVGFIAGDMPNDADTKGPQNWCWGSCLWVSAKSEYPVYPGESLKLSTGSTDSWGKGGWDYQAKHNESRPN